MFVECNDANRPYNDPRTAFIIFKLPCPMKDQGTPVPRMLYFGNSVPYVRITVASLNFPRLDGNPHNCNIFCVPNAIDCDGRHFLCESYPLITS